MRSIFIFILLSFQISIGMAQIDSTEHQFVQFFFPDGTLSSEGYLKNNKPDLYWKTYYETGGLKSEGNRKDFLLDGLWKFYDLNGKITLEIHYKENLKHGFRTTYLEKEVIKENFENDVKQGYSYTYYTDGKKKKEVFYKDGLEEGFLKEFDEEGTIIALYQYKKGFLINREYINRKNNSGKKHGLWMYFYESGNVQKTEEWRNGELNGFVKEFEENGNLRSVAKYFNGEQIFDAEELKQYDIKYDYYESGRIKIMGSYRNNQPDGVRREYNEQGKIIKGYIFRSGIMTAEGVIDEKGNKQGPFKEYFENGNVMAEGKYTDSKKIGYWKFYYQDGTLEQEGNFNSKGKQIGEWVWYYDNGNSMRKENFEEGLSEGSYYEFDINGKTIVQGEYFDGEETGKWFWEIGDTREEGSFVEGRPEGNWKITDIETGKLMFEGKYLDGYPNGKHTQYWDNGTKRTEGFYVMGQKEGEWYYFDSEGKILVKVSYKRGLEQKFDNTQIMPIIED
jgi:uncharacterized protein